MTDINPGEQNTEPKAVPQNPMREIKIASLTFNIGAGKDQDKLKKGLILLKKITGLNPIKTNAKKRIPGWGLRVGLAIGCKVTVRKNTDTMLIRLLTAKENSLSLKNKGQRKIDF